jgi:hypothetical protein
MPKSLEDVSATTDRYDGKIRLSQYCVLVVSPATRMGPP